MFLRLVTKFPEEVMTRYIQFMFLPLITRLVNDESAQCRKMVGLLLKSLVQRAPRTMMDSLLDLVISWVGGGDLLQRRAASQVLGLVVEQLGNACERYLEKILTSVASSISSLLKKDGGWEVCYYLLIASEKLLNAIPKLAEKGDLGQLCALVQEGVLLHKHTWVRLCGSRILGTLFGVAGGSRMAGVLGKCGGGFNVLKALCAQMASPLFDERLGEQVRTQCTMRMSMHL